MSQKKSFKNDFIRGGTLVLAILIFFIGPYFVQSDVAEDIDKLIIKVNKEKKLSLDLKIEILEQLKVDRKFVKQNSSGVDIAGRKIPAVYLLSLIVIFVGFGIPVLTKYLENKKVPTT